MPVINIIICLMYTAKITIIITKQKTIIFDGQICHERGKIEMISYETTHKSLSIHVFLTSVAQSKINKC